MENKLLIGIVGAGSFAAFAAKAFGKLQGAEVSAVSDVNEKVGKKFAQHLNARFYPDYRKLLSDNRVDLVYIATPPFLHFKLSRHSLLAGKHVICEKPAALTVKEAQELKRLAEKSKLLYVVNLMQRYNPMYAVVKAIIHKKLLGNFLHGFFENYASDENLGLDHWFWKDRKSGGIFIEHGIHFFDMFSGWLEKGKIISALEIRRPNVKKKIYDRVQATVLYKGGAVNFYHGFDQPKILDRQELRLQFEKGEITLYGWIPVKMQLHGLMKETDRQKVHAMLGDFSAFEKIDDNRVNYMVKGRFADIVFDNEITICCESRAPKESRYEQMITDMLHDQWQWILNRDHRRMVDDDNAIESLMMAEEAKKIALKI